MKMIKFGFDISLIWDLDISIMKLIDITLHLRSINCRILKQLYIYKFPKCIWKT